MIGLTDKRCNEGGGGPLIDLGARCNLLEDTIPHDGDAITHCQRFFLVVRDIDKGNAELLLIAPDFDFHFRPQFTVEICQWLVQKKQGGTWISDRAPAIRVVADRPKARWDNCFQARGA